ncbi:hypothetical protein DB30_00626 [Enhygromyxa salina]|uniref:GP-PDE domain-containing protein n=2 Tax=Enhygromyxa salina TaxID=215803 RepID=A0A0C2D5A0_9BACT|nr:hypothetical protein DB30_00626 [Enhygromyxa salina]
MGVDGIITDYPDVLLRVLGRSATRDPEAADASTSIPPDPVDTAIPKTLRAVSVGLVSRADRSSQLAMLGFRCVSDPLPTTAD